MNFEKIVVYGAGSTGLIISAAIYNVLDSNYDLKIISRPKICEAISKNGLIVSGITEKEIKFKKRNLQSEIDFELVDSLLICTMKANSLIPSLKMIKDKITNSTAILLLQNGYGHYEKVSALFNDFSFDVQVYSGTMSIGATMLSEHKINYFGGGILVENGSYVRILEKLFLNSFINFEISANIQKDIFRKLIINSIVNPLTAIFYCTNDVIAAGSSEINYLKEGLLTEGLQVAKMMGYDLDLTMEKFNHFINSKNSSSMLQDIRNGKKSEVDFINGVIIKLAKQFKIETPANDFVYKSIEYLEDKE